MAATCSTSRPGVTSRRPLNRKELDGLRSRAGRSYAACSARLKQRAQAAGVSHQRISQIDHGDPTGLPQHVFEWVHAHARHPKVDIEAFLQDLDLLVEEAYAEIIPHDLLLELIHEDLDREPESQADEDVSSHALICALADGDRERIHAVAAGFLRASAAERVVQARLEARLKAYLRIIA